MLEAVIIPVFWEMQKQHEQLSSLYRGQSPQKELCGALVWPAPEASHWPQLSGKTSGRAMTQVDLDDIEDAPFLELTKKEREKFKISMGKSSI